MSAFCKQCSERLFGTDGDFKGSTSQADWERGYGSLVLCEGCGPIIVDPEGRCASPDCLDPNHDGQQPNKGGS